MYRILVIDDEPEVCESMCRLLEREGYEASSAPDGETALSLSQRESFDVIISDIIMPGMSGIDIIKAIRGKLPQTKIIAISGGGNVGIAGYQPDSIKTAAYIAAAQTAGANGCLTKPFSREDVIEQIQKVIGKPSRA